MRYRETLWPTRKWAIIVLFLFYSGSHAQMRSTILLNDVTSKTGISFRHTDGSSGRYYIVESVSSGLALLDYDNDGDMDIYFLNGGALKGTKYKNTPRNALYRNDGNLRFTDVTKESGLGDSGHALGVTVGDYDNDGDSDVYITNFGPNVLFRNNGDGTFKDVTREAGVANGHKVGAGANFLDIDKDGDLDLFVSSYVNFTYDNHTSSTVGGYPVYVDPGAYRPTRDALYRNKGDQTFEDVTEESGIAERKGSGMGTVCADYDNDGDTDIFVANDMMQNFLWQNDGTGKFEEVGLFAGIGYDVNGNAMGSMGIGCGDFNDDGLLDFCVTAYHEQTPSLYENLGNGIFEDIASVAGVEDKTTHTVTWGNDFIDFDNDGDRDLFLALGHLQDNIERWDNRITYLARNILFMNTGGGKFVNVSDFSGDGMKVRLSSRGAAFDDLDNDGDVDVVVLNSRREPTVLKNDSPKQGHWLQIKLQGTKTNRDGVGARVTITTGDLVLVDEVHSGRGYQSHYGTRLYFGLGKNNRADRVEVRWIGGTTEVFQDIVADRLVTLVEGKGEPKIASK